MAKREIGKGEECAVMLAALQPVFALADTRFFEDRSAASLDVGVAAVKQKDSEGIFDWLIERFQYQGVSDVAASRFLYANGSATFMDLSSTLAGPTTCQKLSSYWAFSKCTYKRSGQTCNRPDCLPRCPVPVHQFRNGRLSQSAYSFFLFVRDVCEGDLVDWIDHRLAEADDGSVRRATLMRDAVLEPMTNIYGVSRKVLSMALSDLLLRADPERERWVTTGASMIAIDTLVHNFLVRTGILGRHGKKHSYGPACYGAGGCAEIVEMIADHVDARDFGSEYPRRFPRFIQWSIWLFCAQQGWNVCNGNTINDRQRCANVFCPVFRDCARVRLG